MSRDKNCIISLDKERCLKFILQFTSNYMEKKSSRQSIDCACIMKAHVISFCFIALGTKLRANNISIATTLFSE